MAIHRQWVLFFYLTTFAACEPPEDEPMSQNFFQKYSAPELGTTKFIDPGLLPNAAPPPNFVVLPGTRGQQAKMLDVSCDDAAAVPVTVSIRTEYDIDPNTGNPATGGPLVGTLLWGIGGAFNQLEFDIPSARVPDHLAPTNDYPHAPMILSGNGVQIYLSGASHVSLDVRNDGSVAPLTNPASLFPIGFVAGAKVLAFVSPGSGSNRPVERSIVLAIQSDPLVPVGAVPGTFVEVTVPPFTKTVRFERFSSLGAAGSAGPVEPLYLEFFDRSLGNLIRTTDLGANEEGPIPLSTSTVNIRVYNTGAHNCSRLTAIFDVTPT